MDTKPVPVTAEGLERLQGELHELREVKRPAIVAAIAEARSHGDLRENAAYDAAKDDQALNERRIAELESMLRHAVVAAPASRDGQSITLGTTVVVEVDGEEERYTVVGAIEAQPSLGRISSESPVGKALLGKRPGQTALVATPRGQTSYTIKRLES